MEDRAVCDACYPPGRSTLGSAAAAERCQPCWRDEIESYAQSFHGVGNVAARRQCGCEVRPTRRCHHAITTLPRVPDEARLDGVWANDRLFVGSEAPQTCPATVNMPNPHRGRPFDAIGCSGDIEFVGLTVARLDRRLIDGRDHDASALRLEVPSLSNVERHRPGRKIATDRCIERDGRPPVGRNAPTWKAGKFGHSVGPSAGRVHEDRCGQDSFGASTCQTRSCRRMTIASALKRNFAPFRLASRRNPWSNALASISAQPGS